MEENKIKTYCYKLKLEENFWKKVVLFINKEIKNNLNLDDIGIGAVIYIVCAIEGIKRTQKEIAKLVETTEFTLRRRYTKILKYLVEED